jgi:hypothetical protein
MVSHRVYYFLNRSKVKEKQVKNPAGRALPNLTIVCMVAGLVCSLLMITTESATAQQAVSTTPPVGAVDTATVEDLETPAAKIENDKDRDQLLSQVRALIALQKQKSQKAAEKPFSERLTAAVSKTWEDTPRALSLITVYNPDWEVLAGWVKKQILAPESSSRLSRKAVPVVLILAMAWIFEFIVERPLSRFRKRIEDRDGRNQVPPFGPTFAGAALRLCELAAFTIIAFTAFFVLQPGAPVWVACQGVL